MRTPRLYSQQRMTIDQKLALDKSACNYLASALRMTEGQEIYLFNGEGGEYKAEILSLNKNKGDALITQFVAVDRESPLQIHLAIGISRGDRMDWLVQKATELGVTEITPLFTEHGEVRLKPDRLENKLRHFEKIAINAAEQCGRLDVPAINTPLSLDAFLAQETNAKRLLLEPGGEQRLTASQTLTDIQLLIGPEGGFSEQEVAQARASNCEIMRLGPRVLRTETAPVAALAILQFLYGDLA